MSSARDYYRILHVQPDAPTELIVASYRTLMQRAGHGADVVTEHAHAALLDEALAVLGDPQRRAAYDLERAKTYGTSDRSSIDARPPIDMTATLSLEDTCEIFAGLRCVFCAAPHGLDRSLRPDDECANCASPLFPAERHRLEYSGQRMLSRIPQTRALRLYTGWPQATAHAAELRDISLNGLLLQTAVRPAANQVVKIDGDTIRALARVAHCRRDPDGADRWLVGVEFLTLRFASKLGNFVSAEA